MRRRRDPHRRDARPAARSTSRPSATAAARGSWVVEILNTGTSDQQVSLRGLPAGHVAAYVTSESAALTPQAGPLTAPARSLLTVVVTH